MSEEDALRAGQERVKFQNTCVGCRPEPLLEDLLSELGAALREMEDCGAAPVLPDGRVGGNAAVLLMAGRHRKIQIQPETAQDGVSSTDIERTTEKSEAQSSGLGNTGEAASSQDTTVDRRGGDGHQNNSFDGILVSVSGKKPRQELTAESFCVVNSFNSERWSAEYALCTAGAPPEPLPKPTSDTPLHWASLVEAAGRFDWTERPQVALHGHALADGALAESLGIPVSSKETLCSTPEDVQAMVDLFEEFSYPRHKVFVRKGHGFFILTQSVQEAVQILRNKVKPHMD